MVASILVLIFKSKFGHLFLDHPTTRSLHISPLPRVGGVAINATLVVLSLIYWPNGCTMIAPSLTVLVVVSALDDCYSVPTLVRLCLQFIASLLLVLELIVYGVDTIWQGSTASQYLNGMGGFVVLVLVVTWITNLYNFMDGADGLAGGMSVIGFMAYTIAASANGEDGIAFMSIIISGASLGFLFFNFAPARVFMGDAGSIPLGFLAGALGLMGNLQNAWPWWFPLLVFSPFIVDATVTLLKRACQRKKIWQAHREHYYQRLVLMGWSHKRLALTEYVLMLACAGSALYALQLPVQPLFAGSIVSVQHAILIGWCLVYLALGVSLEIVFSRHQNSLPKTT
jgi:UDP-GlcNAc:undecaprenyl-phosphate/decaprenyl-phosphate GlcNAc-1-phosphate transferase